MKMHILDCGTITMPRGGILVDDIAARDPAAMITIPIEAFLIEHESGLILFDTACDPEGMAGRWPEMFRTFPYLPGEGGTLPERLASLGVAPMDVKTVVASHLHLDHAGCLRDFRNAKIYVNSTEFSRTLRVFFRNEGLGAHVPSDIEGWLDAELQWQPLTPDIAEFPLAPGITILNFGPGHSWGMLGLLAELPRSGPFLLVSDAAYTDGSFGPPPIMPGYLEDSEGYLATLERIRRIAAERGARIVCGHDLDSFRTLVAESGGCLE